MADYEQAVFISYAWGSEREDIVNKIDEALQRRGIRIIRDKRALGYKGSIQEFMERIGQGNCVIVVISDKYLRSPNCMFEMVEIAENKQFHDRVFPIVLGDANIYDPIKRIEYVKYWELKRTELAEAIKTVDPANLQGIRDDMDQYDRIRDRISGITSVLKDMNTLTPEMHREADFSDLYDALVKRMKMYPASLNEQRIDESKKQTTANTWTDIWWVRCFFAVVLGTVFLTISMIFDNSFRLGDFIKNDLIFSPFWGLAGIVFYPHRISYLLTVVFSVIVSIVFAQLYPDSINGSMFYVSVLLAFSLSAIISRILHAVKRI